MNRINYWHETCQLPEEVRASMQTLRVWRNASLHDDQERWRSDGPRSPEAASDHVRRLQTAINVFCAK